MRRSKGIDDLSDAAWDVLQVAVGRFEDAWAAGERPEIEEHLPRDEPARSIVLMELLLADLEFRLKRGVPTRVEDYVLRYPELRDDPVALFELVAAEYRLSRRGGDRDAAGEDGAWSTRRSSEILEGASNGSRDDRSPPNRPSRESARPDDSGVARLLETGRGPTKARSGPGKGPGDLPGGAGELGRFEFLDEAGRGAFGVVYRARDRQLGRVVAVKVPRAGIGGSPRALERFLREARSGARLRHPGIVSIHDAGCFAGTPYLVCEYVPGTTLARRLEAGALEAREAATLVAAIAEALDYAHRRGVVHRDLKPSNILIDPAGRPLVADFGLAKPGPDESTLTLEGQVLGTPAYLSPEQARGEGHRVDRRSDIYSLGVLLYQTMTGELPYRGIARMLLYQVRHEDPRPPRALNDRIPRDLETVCLKAMAKEPAGRYPTAAAFADDLRRFLRSQPVHARPVGVPTRLWRRCRRRPRLAGALAALGLGAAAGLGGIVWQWQRAEAQAVEADRQRLHAKAAFRNAHEAVVAFTRVGSDRDPRDPETIELLNELADRALPYYLGVIRVHRGDRAFRFELAMAHEQVARLQYKHPDYSVEDARRSAHRASQLFEELVREEPHRIAHAMHLAEVEAFLGMNLYDHREFVEAETHLIRADSIWAVLARDHPRRRDVRRGAADIGLKLGLLLKHQGRAEEALRLLRRTRADLEWICREGAPPEFASESLAATCFCIAEQARTLGRLAEAREAALASLDLWGRLASRRSGHRRWGIEGGRAKSAYILGAIENELGRPREAAGSYREAAGLYARLVEVRPGAANFRRDLGASHHNMGNILFDLGAHDEAVAEFARAIEIREALCRSSPGEVGHRRDLVGTLQRMGDALGASGRCGEATTAYLRAAALMDAVLDEARGRGRDDRSLREHEARLSAILQALDRVTVDTGGRIVATQG